MSAALLSTWLTSDEASDRLGISKQSFLRAIEDLQKAIEHKARFVPCGQNVTAWQWLQEDIERLARLRAACPRLCLADCCSVLLAIEQGEV